MSISIAANLAGARVLDVTLSRRSERDGTTEGAMGAQNAAAETQSEGLKRQPTGLDRLIDQPGALDRFRD